MKLPSAYLLAWSVVFLAGGAYILWGIPTARPQLQIVSAVVACVSILLGGLLWAKFRWASELFLVVTLFFLGWGIVATVTDELTRSRVFMIGGGITALFGYPTLRREVRSIPDDERSRPGRG